jgi:hypothetical protein
MDLPRIANNPVASRDDPADLAEGNPELLRSRTTPRATKLERHLKLHRKRHFCSSSSLTRGAPRRRPMVAGPR